MNSRRLFTSSRGVSLVELLTAVVIISTVILTGVNSFSFITKAIRRTRTSTIANNIIQEQMEILKNFQYHQLLVSSKTLDNNDYSPKIVYDDVNFAARTIKYYGQPEFTQYTLITYVDISENTLTPHVYTVSDTGLKRIIVAVVWRDEDGTHKKLEIQNLLADPSAATLDSGFSGTVTEEGSAIALAQVHVEIIGHPEWNSNSTITGFYQFDVASGSYTLRASSAGYYTTTSAAKTAHRGGVTTGVNFVMTPIASGTVMGAVWISSEILISQIVASSGTSFGGAPNEIEWVELYNPTTWMWTIDAANFQLMYREKQAGPVAAPIALTHNVTTLFPHAYYLIASTNSIYIQGGSSRAADAVYTVPGTDIIANSKNGGVGIRKNATSIYWDRFAWEDAGGGPDSPNDFTEDNDWDVPTGLEDGEAFERFTDTTTNSTTPTARNAGRETWGNAYDTNNNEDNFEHQTPDLLRGPFNSSNTYTPATGRPAHGAFISINDGQSVPTQAIAFNVGRDDEFAGFMIEGVTTGTWTATITSGAFKIEIATVIVTQNFVTMIPSTITVSTSPQGGVSDAGASYSILTSTTSGGFVQGFVFGAGTQANTPLSGILMSAGGFQARTTNEGYYFINTATGAITVKANFGQDNMDFGTDEDSGVVILGEVVTIKADPFFHLGLAGTIYGFVTAGTGGLPGVTIRASIGSAVFSAVSDQTGYFYITASTAASAYTLTADIDPLQSAVSIPDPANVTLSNGGETVWSATFTITGGLGSISGRVLDSSGKAITTGVLILASVGVIADPPTSIYASSAPALANPIYGDSSNPNGEYSIEVRAGDYNLSAYYPIVDHDNRTVTYVRVTKTVSGVVAGQDKPNEDFTWP